MNDDEPMTHASAPLGKLLARTEEVRRTQDRHLKAWNDGDVETYLSLTSSDAMGFGATGDLASHAGRAQQLREMYAGGYKPEFVYRNRTVQLHGEVAFTTAYLVGSLTTPSGRKLNGTFRYSEVRVWDDRVWKLAQYHLSAFRVLKTVASRS